MSERTQGGGKNPLTEQQQAFATHLAMCGGLPQRLLDLHVDDGSGHCALCSSGGQTGRYRYPCSLRILAVEALVIQGRMQLDAGGPPWMTHGRRPDQR